jgi:hypothetical protein
MWEGRDALRQALCLTLGYRNQTYIMSSNLPASVASTYIDNINPHKEGKK